MHPTIDELLSLRDGDATARVAAHVADCRACSAELAAHDELAADLRAMPLLEPPRDGWAKVVARVGAPVVLHPAAARWRHAAAGLAASVALAVGLYAIGARGPVDDPARTVPAAGAAVASVDDLRAESQRLESLLAQMDSPRVVTASAAGEIANLEDHIALVDWQLNDGPDRLEQHRARELWQQRVDLMKDLVLARASAGRRNDI